MSEVVLDMTNTRVKGLAIVVDSEQKLLGVVTDGDIRRMIAEGKLLRELTAGELMTTEPLTISETRMLGDAEDTMKSHQIKQLVVLNEQGQAVGVLDMYHT